MLSPKRIFNDGAALPLMASAVFVRGAKGRLETAPFPADVSRRVGGHFL